MVARVRAGGGQGRGVVRRPMRISMRSVCSDEERCAGRDHERSHEHEDHQLKDSPAKGHRMVIVYIEV